MTTSVLWLAWVACVLESGCMWSEHEPERARLAADPAAALQRDCALADVRCSRCHSIDRVTRARVDSPQHWQAYVRRMRLQPQSGITPDEEPPIVRCLVFRTFGEVKP